MSYARSHGLLIRKSLGSSPRTPSQIPNRASTRSHTPLSIFEPLGGLLKDVRVHVLARGADIDFTVLQLHSARPRPGHEANSSSGYGEVHAHVREWPRSASSRRSSRRRTRICTGQDVHTHDGGDRKLGGKVDFQASANTTV